MVLVDGAGLTVICEGVVCLGGVPLLCAADDDAVGFTGFFILRTQVRLINTNTGVVHMSIAT